MTSSDAISLMAAAIASLSLVVSIWQALQNKPHLRLSVTPDMLIFGGVQKREGPFVILSAVNCGAQPTTVTGFGFEMFPSFMAYLRGLAKLGMVVTTGPNCTRLPSLLEPGREAKCYAVQQALDFEKGTKVVCAWDGDTCHSKAVRKRLSSRQLATIAASLERPAI
jgi:hypothetical protein